MWRAAYYRGTKYYAAAVTQRTQYYPSGLPWSESLNPDAQKRKYNGKEFVETNGYDMYDYDARGMYPALARFTTVDPMAEKYYSWSPYAYCGEDPVNNVDPSGEDYWSTNDPEQIRAFLNSVGNGNSQFDFSKNWTHLTDAEFASSLSYNDESGKYYMSYGTVENGEVTINSKSFDAGITPVSFTGAGYSGAFIYKPRSGFWDYLGFYIGTGSDTYFDGFLTWNVNTSGRITFKKPLGGTAPTPGRIGINTQWGWSGTKIWRELVSKVKNGGTIENLSGKIPTKEEAIMLIEKAGGKIERIEGAHLSPNPHVYNHINYTTHSGIKGTIKIQDL